MTRSADEIQDTRAARSRTDLPLTETNRFHDPRTILLAWNEPDPLTQLKLDAVIECSFDHSYRPAALLHAKFERLPRSEQAVFLDFVRWLGEQKIRFSWRTTLLEDEFGVKLMPRR